MSEKRILTGAEIDLIKKTNIVRDYKADAKDSFKGKKYRIYAFGEDAFSVHEDDDFNQDFKDGNVKDVLITMSSEGWSFSTHVTWTRANATKRNQAIYDSITVENFKPTTASVTTELLNSIS